MSAADPSVLDKLVRYLARPPQGAPEGAGSVLVVAAMSYGARPADHDTTVPTGFDPQAAALFESVVEAAFLVASADGHFDADERRAFESVVHRSCGRGVSERQIQALLADLEELYQEDGLEHRLSMVGRLVTKESHQREVLRVASLLASISGGVDDAERHVLERLAATFGLGGAAVDDALRDVRSALAS
ncbi:MAG TPA: tellurite resistance TerB family protein [Polyangiaceae bacterium]|nr:tellurite resistance TerB family protein [Polyangiaceae bacterium]